MALPASLKGPIDCLLIDNFDSFTWNLYQQLCLLGASVTVIRNDAIPPSSLPFLQIKSLIISPGPGHPRTDSGISRDAISHFTGKVPVLGVCMGLECLVDIGGGEISYAGEIMHGKLSKIRHDGRGCFKDIPQGFKSTRYHSLSANVSTLPAHLMITSATEDSGVIMGVRHRKYTLEAVQYHPESILSESGDHLLKNFLALRGGTWEDNPHCGVLDPQLPPFPIEALGEMGLLKNGGGGDNQQQQLGDPKTGVAAKIPSILEKIYSQRLKDIAVAKSTPGTSPADLDTLLAMNLSPPLLPLVPRLKSKQPALMAEIKRASPSKGPIALSANAAQQALKYALAGASVISVLTEPTWFKGSLLDMRLARQAIDSLPNRPAVLRKDFILDEYQIAEARLWGADTVLLIVAMLPTERLKKLYAYSLTLGMEPLVEVNNAREMTIALDVLGAKVIGVNNRNLHDFEVDMGTTSRLVDMVKKGEDGVVLCALSGIKGKGDVKRYTEQGVGAVLVGEALMRAEDTEGFIRNLLDWEERGRGEVVGRPLVKICGIRTREEADAVSEAGADMLGLMFVPSSKRRITIEVAQEICSSVRATRASKVMAAGVPAVEHDHDHDDVDNEPWFARHARLVSANPHRPLLVGVFQNQPLNEILRIVSLTQLDMVQLHGNEPVEWAKHVLGLPVIRVFHVDAEGKGLEGVTRAGMNEFVLVDSVRGGGAGDGLSGGSGKVLDWEVAKRVVEAGEVGSTPKSKLSPPPGLFPQPPSPVLLGPVDNNVNGLKSDEISPTSSFSPPFLSPSPSPTPSSVSPPPPPIPSSSSSSSPAKPATMPIILAGGLTPENVALAIEKVGPWAVDVSGGVEVEDGSCKDLGKVRAFVDVVKGR